MPVRPSKWRKVWFRAAAVALGIIPFVLLELLLMLLDVGRPELHSDPFVGLRGVRPLFVRDEAGEHYVTAKGRQQFFRPESFGAQKRSREFRIFVLGGSTVQGRPFAIETSFTTWLEIALNTAHPERHWEVVNCGGVSYASYRLVPVLEEVLRYQPDLIILYTGHNEFLEDRTYGHIKQRPELVSRAIEIAFQSRTLNVLRAGYLRLRDEPSVASRRPQLPEEVDAMLEYRGGLSRYRRDLKWQRDVISHFRFNLQRMAQLAGDDDVPLLLVNPVSNLRDCPPFKSQHRAALSEAQRRKWEQLWDAARSQYARNTAEAIELLEQATSIDDQHAGLWFELGTFYDQLGRYEQANEAFIRAKELDICPLRILEPMHSAIWEVADQYAVPVVDVRRLFEEQSRGGIPGGRLMVDHVHPSIDGHQMIAQALLEEMVDRGLARAPQEGWEAKRDLAWQQHLDSLDNFYFLKGQQRLKALRNWAAGRATRVRQN